MLIEIVRNSVMQCFCQSCAVPILPAVGKRSFMKPVKVRSKQPKCSQKVNFITTEIRCQEKSRGGLCYDVILAEPSPNTHQPVVVLRNKEVENKCISVPDIERKLNEAEQRRLSLEAKKMADWNAKINKIEQIARKKNELNAEFINQTKESLNVKMGHCEEKRDALITEVKEKLKNHSQEIQRTRQILETQKILDRNAIEEKLKSAAQLREDNMRKTMERLKEHNTTKLTEVKIAADSRESEKIMEKRHVFANKLYIAELNREKELQKKLDIIRKQERRAEIVRKNKAALTNSYANDNGCSSEILVSS